MVATRTCNMVESRTTTPATFIIRMSVVAEANQENRRTRELSVSAMLTQWMPVSSVAEN